MAAKRTSKKQAKETAANIGFEEKLWAIADGLRGNMEPAVYKYDVLGLIFIKYISDRFETHRANLEKIEGADLEDRDEYTAENVFWVPEGARWPNLQKQARQETIGVTLDNAMTAIEKENETLKGVLHKNYARPEFDKRRLGELVAFFTERVGSLFSMLRRTENESRTLAELRDLLLPKLLSGEIRVAEAERFVGDAVDGSNPLIKNTEAMANVRL